MRRGPGSNQYRDRPPTTRPVQPPAGNVRDVAGQVGTSSRQIVTRVPQTLKGVLQGRNLAGQDLTGTTFRVGFQAHGTTFDGADVTGHPAMIGRFVHCSLRGLQAADANLDALHLWSDLTGADLSGATLPSARASTFVDATLVGAYARRRNYDRADFTGADLTGARFTGCTFRGADLSDVKGGLDQTLFRSCVYDPATRFPAGFDLAGWTCDSPEPDELERLDRTLTELGQPPLDEPAETAS